MQASSETSDYGYISKTYPAISDRYDAEVVVSGTGSNSITIGAGESRYIGYTKDASVSANEDKVTITIEEV